MSESQQSRPDRRFPRWVYRAGGEPDPRFTLANERTFLAWIRTALALIAGGVALEVLGLDLNPVWRLAAALIAIVAGIATPLISWVHWMRAERAMRESRALPASSMAPILAAVVLVVGVLVILGIVFR